MDIQVGVLGLQGSVRPHVDAFERLGVHAGEVRAPSHLAGLSHLVIPGGESTTLHHLLQLFGLWEPIAACHRAGTLALFGTCAGAILLGRRGPNDTEHPPRWGLLDAIVRRNAYGRQIDSFSARIEETGRDDHPPLGLEAIFIRAPKIESTGPALRVLARHAGDPILVQAPGLLAATFHPELTGDASVHRLFLDPGLWNRQ